MKYSRIWRIKLRSWRKKLYRKEKSYINHLYFYFSKSIKYVEKLINLKNLFFLTKKKVIRRYFLKNRNVVKYAQVKLFKTYLNRYPDFEKYKVYKLRLFGAALLFLINMTGFRKSSEFDFSYFKVLLTAIHLEIFFY